MNNRDKAAATTLQPCRLGLGRTNTDSTDGKDPRFQALMALAQEGDGNAVGDLWREFGFDFAREGGRHDAD